MADELDLYSRSPPAGQTGAQNSTIQLFETIAIEAEKKPEKILLDLKETAFVDSMSIGLLVGCLLKCQENAVSFRMENVPDHIQKIFESTNIKNLFTDLY